MYGTDAIFNTTKGDEIYKRNNHQRRYVIRNITRILYNITRILLRILKISVGVLSAVIILVSIKDFILFHPFFTPVYIKDFLDDKILPFWGI